MLDLHILLKDRNVLLTGDRVSDQPRTAPGADFQIHLHRCYNMSTISEQVLADLQENVDQSIQLHYEKYGGQPVLLEGRLKNFGFNVGSAVNDVTFTLSQATVDHTS